MATPKDPASVEKGPEATANFERSLDVIRRRMGPDLVKLAQELRMTESDVVALAVVMLAEHLELTRSTDSLVLVVQGSVSPFNTALEAMLASSQTQDYTALVAYLQETFAADIEANDE